MNREVLGIGLEWRRVQESTDQIKRHMFYHVIYIVSVARRGESEPVTMPGFDQGTLLARQMGACLIPFSSLLNFRALNARYLPSQTIWPGVVSYGIRWLFGLLGKGLLQSVISGPLAEASRA